MGIEIKPEQVLAEIVAADGKFRAADLRAKITSPGPNEKGGGDVAFAIVSAMDALEAQELIDFTCSQGNKYWFVTDKGKALLGAE